MAGFKAELRAVFCEAIDAATPQERADYLDRACRGETELRARVETLLLADVEAGGFLREPPGPSANAIGESIQEGPGAVIGPYTLLEEIGEGGFGLVFLAEQMRPVRRQVALKLLKPGMDTRQVIARFEAERQALALMDHPNIARVLDAGETRSGRPYFAMELVRGVPITEYCAQNDLDVAARLELFVTICQAVQHAHHKGIIHRDIKPSNVLVARGDIAPVAKVIDFGIAKALGQQLTEKTLVTGAAQLVGTPIYMSPEQAALNGLDVDTRADIYSLGVLLYELLTGTTPFSKERLRTVSYDEMRRIIREEDPPRPSSRVESGVGRRAGSDETSVFSCPFYELDWIVMKALEKDRTRRYETASAFAADVRHYLRDEPVTACPPSAWYRFSKVARRHRSAFVMAGVLTALLLMFAGTIGWMARDHEEQAAALARDHAAMEADRVREQAAKDARLAGEKTAREAALDDEVTRALDEAVALIDASKWQAAATPVHRAQQLLVAAGRVQIPQRLQELQRDLAMLERLENILEAANGKKTQDFTPEEVVLVNNEFTRAFRDFGIDVPALAAPEAAQRIQVHATRLELAWALDYWATKRKFAANAESIVWAKASGLEFNEALKLYSQTHKDWMKIDWKHLLEVAKAADPDPWRNRLRDAAIAVDGPTLKALSASAPIRQLRPGTLFLLGMALLDVNEREGALALLRKAQHEYPADSTLNETLGWLCIQTFQPMQYEEAARFCSAALAVRPHSAYLHYRLGVALSLKGSHVEALDEFSKAIELDPNQLLGRQERGAMLLGMNRPEAVADFSRVIQLEPSAANWLQRGSAYEKLGQWDKALADFSRAIERAPKVWAMYTRRSRIHAVLGQWSNAAADLDVALEHVPATDRAAIELACYRVAAGDQERYAEACQALVDQFGETNDPGVAQRSALTCLLMPNALKDQNVAVQLADFGAWGAPNDPWGPITRAASRYRQGKFEQTVKPLQEVLKSLPNKQTAASGESLVTWTLLAMANHQLGQTKEAKGWLDRAVRSMDQLMSAKEIGPIRRDTPHIWAMCVALRREAEGLLKN